MSLWARLFKRPVSAECIGPKDFPGGRSWDDRGVLAHFDKLHGLDILVSDATPEHCAENFEKTWSSDADEVLFRRGKRIMLYWRE